MKKINSKLDAIMASMPKVSASADGELKGGFKSLKTQASIEKKNFNCANAGSTCIGIDNDSSTHYENINCPQQEGAACYGKANGTSVNCGNYTTYCGNTLPPTKTSEPTATAKGMLGQLMFNSYLF